MQTNKPINRRQFLRNTFAATTAIGALSTIPGFEDLVKPVGAEPVKRPNVLFIAIDDLNDWVGHLKVAGIRRPDVKTPNIDRLATRGTTFTRAYTISPICGPCRAALMTGVRDSTSGVYSNAHNWRDIMPEVVTLPEHFRNNGYHAIGRGKIHHPPYEEPSSWDDFKTAWTESAPKDTSRSFGQYILIGADPCPEDEMHDHIATDYCIDYLSRSHNRPFFLACGIYNPHLPWYVPQKYFDMHPLDKIILPEVRDDDWSDLPPFAISFAKTISDHEGLTKAGKWRYAVQAYLACVSFADAQVGRLLDALDESPYAENTIICLWSDHGYHLGEKQHWHKCTLWERSCRVPFIWVVPGMTKAGSRCGRTVDLLSVYPTLSSLCGFKTPQTAEGHDITPLLKNPNAEWEHPAITTLYWKNHTVRTERWRYIQYYDGTEELYDHDKDPNEWTNLAGDPRYRDIIERLKKFLPKVDAETAPFDWSRLRLQRIGELKRTAGDKTVVRQSEDTFVLLDDNWQKCGEKTYYTTARPGVKSIAQWHAIFKSTKAGIYKLQMRYDDCGQKQLATNAEFTLIYKGNKTKTFTIDLTKSGDKWNTLGTFEFDWDIHKVLELSGDADGNLITPMLRVIKVNN